MRKSHNFGRVAMQLLVAGLMVFSFNAFAALVKDLPEGLEPIEEALPPPVMDNEKNPIKKGEEEPEITVIQQGEDIVEEYRIGGQLYMQKVTPKNGIPYYMHREDVNGSWINDGPTPPMMIPKWTIFRF